MAKAYIGLGSNLGNRAKNIKQAVCYMRELAGTRVLRVSKLIHTKAVGGPVQPGFVNGVAEVMTELSPRSLLQELLAIERKLGRIRKEKWGPRVIDLDLLFYDDRIVDNIDLKVPHPLIVQRAFVLEPLAELAPELVHPLTGKTVIQHLEMLKAKSR